MEAKPKQKVAAYIDGFNLYFGIRECNLKRFLWLDLLSLARKLVLPHQEVAIVKYFTARISGGRPSDSPQYREQRNASRKRQSDYLQALVCATGIEVFEGQFLSKSMECRKCGATWSAFEEKMTDVNIATELLVDAFANHYDTALLISADSDLVPPVRAVRKCFPHKRVMVAFPPGRTSKELKESANGQFVVSKGHLKRSQLPNEVETETGYIIRRPEKWS